MWTTQGGPLNVRKHMIFWVLLFGGIVLSLFAADNSEVRSQGTRRLDGAVMASGFVLTAIAVGAFAGITSLVYNTFAEPTSYTYTYQKLRALSLDNTVGGRFFLGSGTINGTQSFEYITESDEGQLRVESVPTYMSSVYEDAEPELATLQTGHGIVDNTWFVPWAVESNDETYTFHVPEGSVMSGYNVEVGQ